MNYKHILSQSAFTISNKAILRFIGNHKANALYTYLIDKYYYFSENKMITYIDNEEYFFNVTEDIENDIILTPTDIRNAVTLLTNLGMIKSKLKGIPAKRFFCINFDKLDEVFLNKETNRIEKQDVKKLDNLLEKNLVYITNNKYTNNKVTKNKDKNKEIRKEEEYCENLTISTQHSQKQNELVTFIEDNEAVELHKEYFITSLKTAVEKDYPAHVERCIINKDVFDLYEYSDMTDIKRGIKDFLQSPDMLELKKTIRTNHTLLPKPYNRYNYQKHFSNAGKIRVSNNLFMYSYQVVTLKALFNHNFIIKQLELIDNYLDDDKNYRKYADHYIFVKNWLKREAEKHNERDQFDYYLFGGSRNELL